MQGECLICRSLKRGSAEEFSGPLGSLKSAAYDREFRSVGKRQCPEVPLRHSCTDFESARLFIFPAVNLH